MWSGLAQQFAQALDVLFGDLGWRGLTLCLSLARTRVWRRSRWWRFRLRGPCVEFPPNCPLDDAEQIGRRVADGLLCAAGIPLVQDGLPQRGVDLLQGPSGASLLLGLQFGKAGRPSQAVVRIRTRASTYFTYTNTTYSTVVLRIPKQGV